MIFEATDQVRREKETGESRFLFFIRTFLQLPPDFLSQLAGVLY
jgi:hypothetical protein